MAKVVFQKLMAITCTSLMRWPSAVCSRVASIAPPPPPPPFTAAETTEAEAEAEAEEEAVEGGRGGGWNAVVSGESWV